MADVDSGMPQVLGLKMWFLHFGNLCPDNFSYSPSDPYTAYLGPEVFLISDFFQVLEIFV